METLEAKLKALLERRLAEATAELETLPNGHVSGDVVSSEFTGLDYEDRRHRIRDILAEAKQQGRLSADEVLKVSTLLTYTPQEWSVVTESA